MALQYIPNFFPEFTEKQIAQFETLIPLFQDWNSKINCVARPDAEFLEERHILHALSIFAHTEFFPNTKVLDLGTGGGFPGIPLAIAFPECHFTLVDSIGKKIKVVNDIVEQLQLHNVTTHAQNIKDIPHQAFDYIVSRAVAKTEVLLELTKRFTKRRDQSNSGYYLLKGGDLSEELAEAKVKHATIEHLSKLYSTLNFYETKALVHIPF